MCFHHGDVFSNKGSLDLFGAFTLRVKNFNCKDAMIFERNQGRGRIWKLFKGNATRWGGWGSYELEVH